MNLDIKGLLHLEHELLSQSKSASTDAKVNLLKYLQVEAVLQCQEAFDDLYYEFKKEGGVECLHNIAPVRSGNLLQPKVWEPQECEEDAQLEEQLQFYLADATLAKHRLDELVTKVTRDSEGCEVQYVEVKSLVSTQRKARRVFGGDVRKVADMARVAVVCDTPEALEQAYLAIMGLFQPQDVLRVANCFNSDWTPGGYRDVTVNVVVNEHLCEIKLMLHGFLTLKSGQHDVYEWARSLNVTTEMQATDLLMLSPEVLEDMLRLARDTWRGTGYYLPDLHLAAGQYVLAEEGFRQQLSEAEEVAMGFKDNDSKESRKASLSVNRARARLGGVLEKQGKYLEAESLYVRASALGEKALGPDHPVLAGWLNNRAGLLKKQGRYDEAGLLYGRSLAIREKALGPNHPAVASSLNNRAELLKSQGKYEEAWPLFERSLAVRQKVLGPDHPDVAQSLNNRAELLRAQGKLEEAELLFERAKDIWEKTLGPDHPTVATVLNNLAGLLKSQGKLSEAESLYERMQEILEKSFGRDHRNVAAVLNNRAGLSENQGKFEEAEPLYERSQAILEKVLGPKHPDVATVLNNRAGLLRVQGKYAEAEPLCERSLAIREEALGPDHPDVAASLNNRAELFESQGKYAEAEVLYERSLAMTENVDGFDHLEVASYLNNQAGLLESQGKYDEAEPLYARAFDIRAKAWGPEHSDETVWLNKLAEVLRVQGKYDEAEPLYARAITIGEKALGPEHPDLTVWLNKLAEVLREQGKSAEAQRLSDRALNTVEVLAETTEEHKGAKQATPSPWSTALELLLGSVDDSLMNMLPFASFPSLCQCLLVNRALHEDVKLYLSTLVVDPEKSQGWTVPMDVLQLAPRQLEPPKLVSARCRVSIEGPDEGLRRLNALLVPAPTFLDVNKKTYISLAPTLRCRWRGQNSKGPWVVRFSMADVGGFDPNFSGLVSVLRRPTASPDGEWELLDRVDNMDEASDGEEMVSVTVNHFSDLIPAVEMRSAVEKSRGYIIKPIGHKLLCPAASRTVLLHNASKEALSYLQYWPYIIRTSTTGGLQVFGHGVSGGAGFQVRDPKEEIDEGYLDAWPRHPNTDKFISPSPEPEKLDTKMRGLKLHLVVYTEALGQSVKILVRFECDARNHIILLEEIELKSVAKPSTKAAVRQTLGISN